MSYKPCTSVHSASAQQFIGVFNQSGDTLSQIKYHVGFMGQRIAPVTCLAFHPYKVCITINVSFHISRLLFLQSGFCQVLAFYHIWWMAGLWGAYMLTTSLSLKMYRPTTALQCRPTQKLIIVARKSSVG